MSANLLQSICILGRQPLLGLAELESLYDGQNVSRINEHAAGLGMHASEVDFARLGGSTRVAHVLATVPTNDWKAVERRLPELAVELALTMPDGKIQLGLSSYGLRVTPVNLNAAGLKIKKTLRERTGRSVRYTPNQEQELNTAQVIHNHLTGPTGAELLLIASRNGHTVIARTHSVQNITSYTLRDRGRPKRDSRVGMLPPKLAQIIINFATGHITEANERHASTVLDPFCGTGVVLQEAMLMGYNAYGTDLEQRMIDYSQANLEWLQGTIDTGEASARLEPGDATTYRWDDSFSFVAGETYLGRPFTERPHAEVLAQTAGETNLILKKFLQNIYGQTKTGTRFCLAVPAWQTSDGKFKHLPLIDQLGDLGYNRVSFEHVRDEQLLYYREDQIVARQLLVLTRK